MPKEFNPQRLDVKAFAEDGAQLAGQSTVARHERLAQETEGRRLDQPIAWSARGELRNPQHVQPEIWLHLQAATELSLRCQRCLNPVDTPVAFERSFRFVADEATAEAEDDESEEDLLVLSRQFDLMALIEDELLMEMPLVPRHAQCPVPVMLQASDPEVEAESTPPHPFAVLGRLKGNEPKP